MSKLWSKGYELDAMVEDFTVGEDYILDDRLISADVLGSLAHATMLERVRLLDHDALTALRRGLLTILDEHENGSFTIHRSDEDGHTAIENRLVDLVGDAGKRIHLGRSRNDQVLTTLRIWMRHYLFHSVDVGGRLVSSLLDFAETYRDVPMPGRTHMQPAMPSSVGLWSGGFAEQLLDDLRCLAGLFPYFDQCPLGSGAGYGTPLPLDREFTASLLGFSRIQSNAAYSGLSRGKFESRLLDSLDQIAITLSKLATDLILFSLPEFGWFSLPQELCTGSSIMPQKRNPDALELMRSKAASIGAFAGQVKSIIRSLPSGYNRDFQDTKDPMMKGADTALSMMEVSGLTIRNLGVNEDKLLASFNDGIFATDAAISLVAEGMSFRDAYREVGTHPERYSGRNPKSAILDRRSTGTAGNLALETAGSGLLDILEENREHRSTVEAALTKLAGREVTII
ncbi:MAG: argininosuccinate lyase [Spirochaetaceae bacterium]|nr:argininosuccinate lyase [Spirochaetaceae bacterium]MDT8297111.1 argininosuccinate lyase [Spirochaetaceae bacterium]